MFNSYVKNDQRVLDIDSDDKVQLLDFIGCPEQVLLLGNCLNLQCKESPLTDVVLGLRLSAGTIHTWLNQQTA